MKLLLREQKMLLLELGELYREGSLNLSATINYRN